MDNDRDELYDQSRTLIRQYIFKASRGTSADLLEVDAALLGGGHRLGAFRYLLPRLTPNMLRLWRSESIRNDHLRNGPVKLILRQFRGKKIKILGIAGPEYLTIDDKNSPGNNRIKLWKFCSIREFEDYLVHHRKQSTNQVRATDRVNRTARNLSITIPDLFSDIGESYKDIAMGRLIILNGEIRDTGDVVLDEEEK